jgi:hypothetical protein
VVPRATTTCGRPRRLDRPGAPRAEGGVVSEQFVLDEPDLARLSRDAPGGHRRNERNEQESDREQPRHGTAPAVRRLNAAGGCSCGIYWSARTTMRRYTRLSNGCSRKFENNVAAVAINYFAYNFIKIHRSLRVTPAMEAKIATRPFDVMDLVNLLIEAESKKAA